MRAWPSRFEAAPAPVVRSGLGTRLPHPKDDLIQRLPDLMEKEGWAEAARLMRLWQSGEAPAQPLELHDGRLLPVVPLRWSWWLGFDRAAEAMKTLQAGVAAGAFLADPAPGTAFGGLYRKLWPVLARGQVALFSPQLSPVTAPRAGDNGPLFVTLRSVGGVMPVDDLHAALGEHTLRLYMVGSAAGTPAGATFTVHGYLARVVDTYDFVNRGRREYLGSWSPKNGFQWVSYPNAGLNHVGAPTIQTSGSIELWNEDLDAFARRSGRPRDFATATPMRAVAAPGLPKTFTLPPPT